MAIYKSLSYIYLLAAAASLGGYTTGLFFTLYNATKLEMFSTLDLSSRNDVFCESLLQSLVPLGALVGGLLSGPLAAAVGRRLSMILIDVLTVVGCVLTGADSHPNLTLFLFGRFICGITAGLNWTIVTLYIRETSPANMSGRTGSFFKIFFAVGIFTNYLLSLILPDKPDPQNKRWQILYLFPIVVTLTRTILLLFVFNFDTPKYYILKNQDSLAEDMLRQLYKEEYVSAIYDKEKKAPRFTAVKEYFTGKFKKQFMLACSLIVIFQFTGINLVMFYSTDMFFRAESNISLPEVRVFNIMIGLIRVISSLFAGVLADKFGRRAIFLAGSVLITIALFFMGIFGNFSFSGGIKFLVLFYTIANGFTFTTLLPVYMAEILPLTGCGLAVSFENLLVFVVTYLYPFLVNDSFLGLYNIFYLCCVSGVAGFIFVISKVKETKGKKDIEIFNEFNTEGADVGLLDEDMLETLNSQGLALVDRPITSEQLDTSMQKVTTA